MPRNLFQGLFNLFGVFFQFPFSLKWASIQAYPPSPWGSFGINSPATKSPAKPAYFLRGSGALGGYPESPMTAHAGAQRQQIAKNSMLNGPPKKTHVSMFHMLVNLVSDEWGPLQDLWLVPKNKLFASTYALLHLIFIEVIISVRLKLTLILNILIFWYWYWPVLYKLHVSSCFGCKIFVSKPSKKGIPNFIRKSSTKLLVKKSVTSWPVTVGIWKKWRFLVKFPKYHDQNGGIYVHKYTTWKVVYQGPINYSNPPLGGFLPSFLEGRIAHQGCQRMFSNPQFVWNVLG